MNQNEFITWYRSNKELYSAFTNIINSLVETLLQEAEISYHSVSGRIKTEESIVEKTKRKDYSSPEQITDLSGVRIITYTTAEIPKVCGIIEKEFEIDVENSGDKLANLDPNQVGYLSIHYVLKLKSSRTNLAEYKRYEGLYCEVQIRSLLQHAWAEIEHDRNYKFSGILPKELRRRFYLVAGTLELMDNEFTNLTKEIDKYAKHVQKQTEEGDLNIPIDSTSLVVFLDQFFRDCDVKKLYNNYKSSSAKIIQELQNYGINTIQELFDLLHNKSADEWVQGEQNNSKTYIGILREAMITNNPEQYFRKAWNENWLAVSKESFNHWRKKGFDPNSVKTIVTFVPSGERNGEYWVRYV